MTNTTNSQAPGKRAAAAAMLLLLAMAMRAGAEPTRSDFGCYTISFDVSLAGNPEEVYDAVTGDISGWWDHTFSENPVKLFVNPIPGGGFVEIFDRSGNGVMHARVIYADRGKLLRMNGPLGLSGKAVDGVYTYSFAPDGENTTLSFEANLAGQITAEEAALVEQVWQHFLVGRLKPYLENGAQ